APTAPAPPSPVPPPLAPAGELTLATLRELWPAAVDAVRAENAMLAAALADARPLDCDGTDVTLALPTGAAFSKRMAESEAHRRLVGDALRTLAGVAVRPRYELRDLDPEEAAAAAALPGAPALSDVELVARFVAEFDAEELIDDDEEGGS
ncbi:MAG: polymerase subunit gamma and tau, partial [Conexibacter sp.]|nr:polymerase subunit gamma and tau [Conexibacter sp.]